MSSTEGGDPAGYDAETRQMLEMAKKEHVSTTKTLQASEKIAEDTKKLAATTLETLHEQGRQLEGIGSDFQKVEEKASSAEKLVRWFERQCCCFTCPDFCCGSTLVKKYQNKYNRQKLERKVEQDEMSRQEATAKVSTATKSSGASGAGPAHIDDTATRGQFKGNRRAIGQDLGDDDGVQIMQESHKQDKALNNISDALDVIKYSSQAMQEELGRQETAIDDLSHEADKVQGHLKVLSNSKPLRKFR